jgi:hypothetical protein
LKKREPLSVASVLPSNPSVYTKSLRPGEKIELATITIVRPPLKPAAEGQSAEEMVALLKEQLNQDLGEILLDELEKEFSDCREKLELFDTLELTSSVEQANDREAEFNRKKALGVVITKKMNAAQLAYNVLLTMEPSERTAVARVANYFYELGRHTEHVSLIKADLPVRIANKLGFNDRGVTSIELGYMKAIADEKYPNGFKHGDATQLHPYVAKELLKRHGIERSPRTIKEHLRSHISSRPFKI